MDETVKAYLREIGQRGGRRSRRELSAEQARDMVRVREARRLFRRFYGSCFWNAPKDLVIGPDDVDWVVKQLRENGGHAGWEAARRLCR